MIRIRPVVLVLAALAAGCGDGRPGSGGVLGAQVERTPAPSDPVEFGPLMDFELTAQTGEPCSLADLRGTPFVMGAIFTRCYGPCPRITRSMRRLQDELAGTDVRLVSISVDPAHDSPEVLAAYAESYGVDLERWVFLTGDETEVYDLVRQGFWLGVDRADGEESVARGVTHSTDLVAIDRQGRRRGWYDGEDEDAVDRLAERMRHLASEGP